MSVQEKAVEMEPVTPRPRGREGRESEEEFSRPDPTPPTRSETPPSFREAWQQARTATASTTWDEYESLVKTNTPQEASSHSVDGSKEDVQEFDDAKLKALRKPFNPRKQLKQLLLDGFGRWSITALLVLCLYLTLWRYSTKSVMSQAGKLRFNALVTGISIALGLNIASSLREMALEMRWWILSRRTRSLYEVDLILNSDSPYHLFKLVMTSPRVNVILGVLLWILLNLGAQIGVALLGLAYSVDSAGTFGLTVHGNVSIPNMTFLATENIAAPLPINPGDDRALRYTANSFGVVAVALGYDFIDDKPQPRTLYSSDNSVIFTGDNYAQYVFFDASPDGSISIATNRTITSTGLCRSYPVVDGGDGSKNNITIKSSTPGAKPNHYIPITAGLNQTTYVTHLSKSCGEGCGVITALETSLETPFFYECNVTVGKVGNATIPQQDVAPSVRTLAASAIAMQGYVAASMNNNTDLQFQSYPSEFVYGLPQAGDTQGMGLLLAMFAMGVIAVAAQNNPQILVPGDQPQAGLALNVSQWKYVHLILGLTAGLQLVLFVTVACVANRAIVKDKSHLAIARLLRPYVERLGDAGTTASGKEISDVFGRDEKVVYGVEDQGGDATRGLRLGLGSEGMVRRFPRGVYD